MKAFDTAERHREDGDDRLELQDPAKRLPKSLPIRGHKREPGRPPKDGEGTAPLCLLAPARAGGSPLRRRSGADAHSEGRRPDRSRTTSPLKRPFPAIGGRDREEAQCPGPTGRTSPDPPIRGPCRSPRRRGFEARPFTRQSRPDVPAGSQGKPRRPRPQISPSGAKGKG